MKLQPGEAKYIDVPGTLSSPPTTYLTQDPFTKKLYGPGGQERTSLVSGVKRTIVPFKLWGQMQNSAGLLGVTN